MLFGIGISGTGALIEQNRLENLSNNLANLRTPGFKRDLMVFMQRPVESQDIQSESEIFKAFEDNGFLDLQGGGVHLRDIYRDTQQGFLETTDNQLDFALNGPGYFNLEHPQLGSIFTRAGNFTLNSDGDVVTSDGAAYLLDADGERLNFNDLAASFGASGSDLGISKDGRITVLGANGGSEDTGRAVGVSTLTPVDEAKLEKLGHTFLGARMGESISPTGIGADTEVLQRSIETSTGNSVQLMAEMVEVSRIYETNMKLLKMQDSTLQQLISRVGDIPAN